MLIRISTALAVCCLSSCLLLCKFWDSFRIRCTAVGKLQAVWLQ